MLKKPVTKVLITHAHHDHLDGLDVLKHTFPTAVVYISKREEKLMRNDLTLEPEMAFLDERSNSNIAGDAFQMLGGFAVAGVLRPTFPMPAKGTWSKTVYRQCRSFDPSICGKL